jgi:hypothetical protein
MKNGKLELVYDYIDGPYEKVRVLFNDRTFEVHSYTGRHLLEQVVAAALSACVSTVPKDENKASKAEDKVEF